MLTYEALDTVADAVNPLLLIATLLLPAWPRLLNTVGGPYRWYVCIAAVLLFVYGLMALDSRLALWHFIGSDYSTHTALALGLTLLWCAAGRRAFTVVCLVFVAYLGLMLYQRYHTLLDVTTTAVPVGAFALFILWITRRLRKKDSANEI